MSNQKRGPEKLVLIAMLAAAATVLYFLEFPVLPAQPHLKLDFGDLPAFIAAVVLGPAAGVLVELIKNVIEMMIRGFGSQMGYGNLMNFLVGCAYIVPYALIYRKWNARFGEGKTILMSAAAGFVCILVVGFAGNLLVAPLYFKFFLGVELSNAALWGAVWGAAAINAAKGILLSVLSVLYFKAMAPRLTRVLRREG